MLRSRLREKSAKMLKSYGPGVEAALLALVACKVC